MRTRLLLKFGAVGVLLGLGCADGAYDDGADASVGMAAAELRKGQPGAVNGMIDYCDDPANPCVIGEGDCDADFQCTGAGVVCGTGNGLAWGINPSLDVCWPSTCQNGVLDPGEVEIDNGGPCGCWLRTYYFDWDDDGYGRATNRRFCDGAAPARWTLVPGDCDDTNPLVNPGAMEICGNLIDEDCDGVLDNGCTTVTWCVDNDGDGFPRSTGCRTQVAQPGYNWLVVDATTVYDCDDANPAINPAATEICGNLVDEDCDGVLDNGCEEFVWCVDNDGDGFPRNTGCRTQFRQPGYNWLTTDASTLYDCVDTNPAIFPGATEICDGVDNNCSGIIDDGCIDLACFNGVQDGAELGVDCGGYCDVCDGGAIATSCVGLPPTCGAGGNDDCCASSSVLGADYLRSFDDVGFTDSSAPATAYSFVFDRYEVSVGRFKRFLADYDAWRAGANPSTGAGAHPYTPGTGWDAAWSAFLPADSTAFEQAVTTDCTSFFPTFSSDPSADSLPMGCLTWYEAFAFCVWDGGRLPSEAEWNLAAAGGAEQRVYPWSSPPTSSSIDLSRAIYGCNLDGDSSSCTLADVGRVGQASAGAGRWGHFDLAGNLWEWTMDRYSATYPVPCENCVAESTSGFRPIRGGGYSSGAGNVRSGARSFFFHTNRSGNLGVRCARGQ